MLLQPSALLARHTSLDVYDPKMCNNQNMSVNVGEIIHGVNASIVPQLWLWYVCAIYFWRPAMKLFATALMSASLSLASVSYANEPAPGAEPAAEPGAAVPAEAAPEAAPDAAKKPAGAHAKKADKKVKKSKKAAEGGAAAHGSSEPSK